VAVEQRLRMAEHDERVMEVISVPERFATDTLTREGEAAREWLETLPVVVSELCERWDLRLDGPPMHGYQGLAIPVTRAGEDCVLKVSWLRDETVLEAAALSIWDGDGAVRLLTDDRTAGAMLLERLDPRRSLNVQGLGVAVPAAGRLLRRLAVPAAAVPAAAAGSLPALGAWAARLSAELPDRWRAAGQPFPRPLLDEAVELAAALAPEAGSLLVNRDLRYAKVLAAQREPWLVIAPKPIIGDIEFGVAPLLWHRFHQAGGLSGLRYRLAALIDAAELDNDRTRAWTLLHVIHYWLWGRGVGRATDPARCEAITTWLALARLP
jgi:streptomycin 6-kinase